MLAKSLPKPVAPLAVKAMLGDGEELALIDLREELIFSQNHLLFARSVPLSRIELNFARLVPRRGTRIVLCDDGDGLVERAAEVLAGAGYTSLHALAGGVAGWAQAGLELFSGVNVPSKAFGEFIEHACATPSISAAELNQLIQSGTDMVVLDSRPFDEYERVSIPTGVNVPGAELVLRVHDVAPSPATLVVVNCAGRTRSIIGAQSLINAGIPNKVVALRNGTMGWNLAGLTCEKGQARRAPQVSREGLAFAKSKAEHVAQRFGVSRIDRATLTRWQGEREARTLYLFDVRDPREYAAGHIAGALSAPGGQLVQATDQYVGIVAAPDGLDRSVRAGRSRGRDRLAGTGDFGRTATCAAAPHRRGARRPDSAGRSHCGRSVVEPRLPEGTHSRRLFRHPITLGINASENSTARHARADVGGWRTRRTCGRRDGFAHRSRRPLPRRRQCRVASRGISADRRRSQNGRRSCGYVAQALRARQRHDESDERLSLLGSRPA
jgi:rhodanese-related sulfurtransferase